MSAPQGVKFIYIPCKDVTAMRHFYTDLLGLDEIYFNEGMLAYDCDGLQFTFFVDDNARHASDRWAWQPGWEGGKSPVASWSASFTEDEFRTVVGKLMTAGIDSFYDKPQWNSYWGFPVKDPMGNTVEVVWALEEEPENMDWL